MSQSIPEPISKHIRRLSLLRLPIVALVLANVVTLSAASLQTQSSGVLAAAPTGRLKADPKKGSKGNKRRRPNRKKRAGNSKQKKSIRVAKRPALRLPSPSDFPRPDFSSLAAATAATQRTSDKVISLFRAATPGNYQPDAFSFAGFARRVGKHWKPPTPVVHTLILNNPPENSGVVHFRINDDIDSLEPGQTKSFKNGPWSLDFHRGNALGIATHQIQSGEFEFKVTAEAGWSLKKTTK